MARVIQLTKGKVAIVDDDDYVALAAFKWRAHQNRCKRIYYAARASQVSGVRRMVLMHRVIMGAKPGQMIDHRDGNGLNNRRSNLRFTTQSGNSGNSIKRLYFRGRLCTSKFKGVSRCRSKSNPWRATITARGAYQAIGSFATELEAAIAYDAAARKHFGDFAKLNFPGCAK